MAMEEGWCFSRRDASSSHTLGVLSIHVYVVGELSGVFARKRVVVRRRAENWVADLRVQKMVSSAYSRWLICGGC